MSNASEAELVRNAVRESLSGITALHRAASRSAGMIGYSLASVPLTEVVERARVRLYGMDEPAIESLTIERVRDMLNELGFKIVEDCVEIQVLIPPARKAHAR